MADGNEEVEEMVAISSYLLINIGTLNDTAKTSMLLAGKRANALGIPVLLDPVGAGATAYRKQATQQLLKEIQFALFGAILASLPPLRI